ncbi:MAG TPA: phosphoenolpyruvate carboxykinase, partial [Clostridiales bacterium]|nr:phosphoenolpyruvate carboxykinase [Clostridiales bacterium]
HWIEMGKKIPHAPKIFNVNWFRTDDQGNFIWPGFGDNMRVLMWILARCEDKVDARDTAIGYIPEIEDIELDGLDVSKETLEELLHIDQDLWLEEAAGIDKFYAQFDDKFPQELKDELATLKANLK